MNKRVYLTMTFLALTTTTVFAQGNIQKQIEKRQGDCVDKDPSTVGMTDCAQAAYEEWDRELNKAYKALMKALPEKKRDELKASQRAWIKFRDLEFKNIANVYEQLEGTMYRPMHIESRVRILRERVLQLHNYLDLLGDGG